MSKFNNRAHRASGFTLLEVIVSIMILVIGLVGIAFAMTNSLSATTQSKAQSMAATLASEKLEDLSRWPPNDTHVAAGGALGISSAVSGYFDEIGAADTGDITTGTNPGAYIEVVSQPGGNYLETIHSADGSITTTTVTSVPNIPMTFERTWLVEANTPVTEVRRITVLVSSLPGISPAINFQMSMVRP